MSLTRRNILRLAAMAPLAAFASRAGAEAHSTTHVVTIQNMAFTPAELTIAPGDTVQFTNADNVRHSAMDLGGAWDTGLLSRGQSASLTFNGAGTFNYRCGPHANMRGSITIA